MSFRSATGTRIHAHSVVIRTITFVATIPLRINKQNSVVDLYAQYRCVSYITGCRENTFPVTAKPVRLCAVMLCDFVDGALVYTSDAKSAESTSFPEWKFA